MTTIAYIGNFKPDRSTENAYRYAFEKLGCEVIPLQQERVSEIGVDASWREFDPRPEGSPLDLVLYTRTHNHTALTDDLWTFMWRNLEHFGGVQTASVHLDVFVGAPDMNNQNHEYVGHKMMHRDGMRNWRDPLFTTGHVFTPDPLLANYITTDATVHHWLPPAADVRAGDPPGEPIEGLAGKVVFVGSRYGTASSHPEYPERVELLDWLEETYAADFYWYGPGSPRGTLRGKQLWDVYASDCVIVGDSCFAQSWEGRPYYWSDRVPETLAHGGYLIHPVVAGLAENFPRLEQWYTGSDVLDERIGLMRDALPARQWRGEAQALARRDHTYVNRAREILDTLGLEHT